MNEINLSALSDRELIRFVEGRELTPLERELLRRLEEWAELEEWAGLEEWAKRRGE